MIPAFVQKRLDTRFVKKQLGTLELLVVAYGSHPSKGNRLLADNVIRQIYPKIQTLSDKQKLLQRFCLLLLEYIAIYSEELYRTVQEQRSQA